MTEELNVDELETPPYTPPYPTDDELDWYVNIFSSLANIFSSFVNIFSSMLPTVFPTSLLKKISNIIILDKNVDKRSKNVDIPIKFVISWIWWCIRRCFKLVNIELFCHLALSFVSRIGIKSFVIFLWFLSIGKNTSGNER